MASVSMDATTTWSWTLGGIVLLSFILFIIKKNMKKKSRLPPGPAGSPIFGNLFHLGKMPNESLLHLSKKYGPLMTLQLGMRTAVVVSSPAMAREVLKNNDHVFAGRMVPQVADSMSYSESSVIWNQYGPRWRMLRKICSTELFSAKRLTALQHLRRDQVFRTIRLIYEEDCSKGKMVNIGHTAFLTSLNLLSNMIFARDIFGRDSQDAKQLKENTSNLMVILAAPNFADYFPILRFLDLQGLRRDMTAILKRSFWWFDKLVEDRLSSSAAQNNSRVAAEKDFLDVLLDHRSDGENLKFTRTDLITFVHDLLLAGSETTATTIEWAMTELIRSPDRMKRAQAELDEVVGRDRKVEESDIQHLPYLQAVVKEVFRLHPALPLLLPHRADESCEIAGFVIPKHSQVIVNVWAMGRDPSIWSEPLEFVPERFVGSEMDFKGNYLELMPFGAGRRICPGLPLANRMVHFGLASLLHSFDWSLPQGQTVHQIDMTAQFGVTLQKALPLTAIATARLQASLYY